MVGKNGQKINARQEGVPHRALGCCPLGRYILCDDCGEKAWLFEIFSASQDIADGEIWLCPTCSDRHQEITAGKPMCKLLAEIATKIEEHCHEPGY